MNINQAIAEANRLQRAHQIIKKGYTFTQENDMVAVCKPNELHASYWIGEHVDGTDGCDCPDRIKTSRACKHEMAWKLICDREEIAAMEAQAAQWEAEEANV